MVKINDIYSFNADTRCYTLYEKYEVTNKKADEEDLSDLDGETKKEGFRAVAYYPTMESLINGILKRELRKSISKEEITTLKEIKEKIKELHKYIESLDLNV